MAEPEVAVEVAQVDVLAAVLADVAELIARACRDALERERQHADADDDRRCEEHERRAGAAASRHPADHTMEAGGVSTAGRSSTAACREM